MPEMTLDELARIAAEEFASVRAEMRTGFEELRGEFREFAKRTDSSFEVLTDILKSIRDGFGRHDAELTKLRLRVARIEDKLGLK